MMPFKLMQAAIDPTALVDVFDHGEIQRDWTYIDDVIDAFVSALAQPLGYEILNIGCGNPIKLSMFIEQIEEISSQKINQRPMKSHKTEPTITFCDNSKVKKLLNFSPKIDVRQGLEKMWQWFEEEYRFETTDFD